MYNWRAVTPSILMSNKVTIFFLVCSLIRNRNFILTLSIFPRNYGEIKQVRIQLFRVRNSNITNDIHAKGAGISKYGNELTTKLRKSRNIPHFHPTAYSIFLFFALSL